jgi:TolB-like protein
MGSPEERAKPPDDVPAEDAAHAAAPAGAPESSRAVFLSYASQDAGAARRIRDALRGAGVEVWFDQSELRGGDAWDHSIRKQIKTCALFIPVISRHTHDRDEGYFRLEWKLAVDRCHLMAADRTFLMPVVVDDTRDDDERVPERFCEVQWTRLPEGQTPPAFVQRVQRLLTPQPSMASRPATTAAAAATPVSGHLRASWFPKALLAGVVAVLGAASGYLLVERPWSSTHLASQPVAATAPVATASAFAPPPHSIAVLPFVNMSGDKEQEYFSDGLSEELLNDLSRINELQVAARTSTFSFKGKDADISTIARKLNVGSVLEGSVRRSGHTVRITAQLINAVTGFHLWSQTYDRDLGDLLKLQTEIAESVASALRVTLLRDEVAKIEVGGTRNPAAFDAYLRAMRAYNTYHDDKDLQAAVATFTDAIQLDPSYALAYAGRSLVSSQLWDEFGPGTGPSWENAVRADALKAIALAPGLGEGHLALAVYLSTFRQDMTEASREYERAATVAPGNTQVLRRYALSAAELGRTDAAIAAAQRAVTLDPLTALTRRWLARVLWLSRHYREAITAADETSSLDAGDEWAPAIRGESHYLLGDFQRARLSCEIPSDNYWIQLCLAIVYQRIGQHPQAEAALAKIQGDNFAYQYMQIFAQWGNNAKALAWLDTAMRLHDSGLSHLKSDPLLDPLRNEPRFHAIEKALKFPD